MERVQDALHFYITKGAIFALKNVWGVTVDDLKELRIEKKMTQQEVADLVGISLRSYKSYENDEETGILELDDIVRKCSKVFEGYDVNFCYLFGSYAKEKATPVSDVDLLISVNLKGLMFFGLVEEIRMALNKKVDVISMNQLEGNSKLTEEILKYGIRIYG